jgi:glycine/D-amino acid oxidase-like deaminating enzyme
MSPARSNTTACWIRCRTSRLTPIRALAAACRAFPVFAKAEIAQRWAGYIDVTPDAVPVISAVDRVPGFYLASGFSGHGFGIGPAAGRLMADLVTGKTPLVDPPRSGSAVSPTVRRSS